MNAWLACGIKGHELEAAERRELEALQPGGLVLFARNVAGREQFAALVGELRALSWQPYVAIDMEGGRVNRLGTLTGPLPSPGRAAATGAVAVHALGEALGATCAYFGLDVDYAPVVDVGGSASYIGGEGRCLGTTPTEVETMALHILAGIESFGVATCLKHYPGLGSGLVDSHRELPQLDEEVNGDEEVFRRLAMPARAVMVAHAMAPSLGEPFAPCSLARRVVGRLNGLPCGPVIADDLEMGALGRWGSLAERACAALAAGCHQVLVCNALAERSRVCESVEDAASRDTELAAALRVAEGRVASYGRGALASVSWDEVLELASRARELAGIAA